MEGKSKARLASSLLLGGIVLAGIIAIVVHYAEPISLRGAVVKQDSVARQQSPITDVEVSVADGVAAEPVKSDFTGYFKLTLPRGVLEGHPITLQFRHPDYEPFDLKTTVGKELYIAHMTPIAQDSAPEPNRPAIAVANVFVRYSIETTTSVNIGTGLKTFQIVNDGNVPCSHHPPCSPDGKWKAAIGSASLDAGTGNQYEDARFSCIAGPCPFTKVVSDGFSRGGRAISISVLDWSDTTTFLLQAEVFTDQISNMVRELYPVIFGQSMNFTLPASAEGPSLEAEINGTNIIFPIGPTPTLSWAGCNVRVMKDESKMYRCELQHGYRFR